MSENEKSLEDFFAKKSKKKGAKGKGKKFTTSDEIAKKLVEQDVAPTAGQSSTSTDSATKKSKAEKTKVEEGKEDKTESSNLNYRFQDDENWTDFHDEFQKDYSGLKVQALQITDELQEGEEEQEEVDENGEPIKSKGQGPAGPWNKNPDQAQPAPAPVPVPEPEPPKEEPKPATTGKYVPPSKRAAAAAGPLAAAMKMGRKGKAPQINSQFEFPTLAASSDLVKHSNKVEDATFSTVTKGGQAMDGAASKGPDLQLGNRYAALGGN